MCQEIGTSRSLQRASWLLLVSAVIHAGLQWSCTRADVLYDEKVSRPGVSARLHCTNSTQYHWAAAPAPPAHGVVRALAWMLPDLGVLRADRARFQLLDHNWTLQITGVTRRDLGIYRCLLQSTVPQYAFHVFIRFQNKRVFTFSFK